jgi:hypothetical protein
MSRQKKKDRYVTCEVCGKQEEYQDVWGNAHEHSMIVVSIKDHHVPNKTGRIYFDLCSMDCLKTWVAK